MCNYIQSSLISILIIHDKLEFQKHCGEKIS